MPSWYLISSSSMDSKLRFLFLALAISFISANARNLASLDVFVEQVDNVVQSESNIGRNEQLCTLCEEYASQALYYLSENETQSQIISKLHKACSRLHSIEQQCITLVDYYAPLFFLEVTTVTPEQFCKKVNLCGDSKTVYLPKRDDPCTICHNIVVEVLTKLQDPDTELEVIEVLLKGCNKMENYAKKCKKLVLAYGPLILANAEKFLEATDVCTSIHACKKSQQDVTGSILADA